MGWVYLTRIEVQRSIVMAIAIVYDKKKKSVFTGATMRTPVIPIIIV